MKKIYLLLTVLILTLSCQKEEIITNKEKDSNLLSTVDEKEALHILSREKSKNNFKSQNETYAVPDFENLHYKEITNSDALLTIIPASVPDNAESQILMLKIENEIQTVVLSMYPDSQHNIDFSGVFIIRNLYGNFKEGYRVENGRIIAKLVKTKSKLKTGWEDGDWNDGELGEVIVDAPGGNRNTTPVKYVFVIRIHDEPGRNGEDWEFEYSSGGGGGGTTTTPTEEEEEDKIYVELDDKELCAYQRLKYAGVNATNYHNLMTQLFAEFGEGNLSNSDLTITSEDLGYSGGKSVYLGDGKFKIIISNMSDRSSIEIAAVILHEMSHAFLAKHYLLYNKSFAELYSMYINDTGIENYSHDIMKDKFLVKMAQTLQDYDSSLFSNFQDYITLASPGVYSNYSEEQLAEIKRIKNYAWQNDSRCTISK